MSSYVHKALPAGQVETEKFPVIGERDPGESLPALAQWSLQVSGLVREARTWSWSALIETFREETCAMDIHCVTGWTRRAALWRGVRLSDVLEASGVDPCGAFVRFEAYSMRAHDTSVPLDVAMSEVLLAHTLNGERITREHGGPLRVVVPSRWFYKSLKWVRSVEVCAEDRLGYWERTSGYHNNADPWANEPERYIFGAFPPAKLDALRLGRRVDRWRGAVVLGVDLQGWNPQSRDLHKMVLKSCDLRGACLEGCNLQDVNFTRCDLRGARLCGADLTGADLEGADLRGADLTGATLDGAWLTAVRVSASEGYEAARLVGVSAHGARGVLEEVEAEFHAQGVV